MPGNKAKFMKNYGRLLKEKDAKNSEFGEAEKQLSEDTHESEEGLGIDEEETAVEETYPEIAEDLVNEDSPEKEDE